MKRENVVYKLDCFYDDPRYEGFAARTEIDFLPDRLDRRDWRVRRLAPSWKPLKVLGRVSKFNDYPCVDTLPAFSQRAADALRDFLEPNGELLPLVSKVGTYYAYNVTTIADVFDRKRSDADWKSNGLFTFGIRRFEFLASKLDGLSIFRIPETPMTVYITEPFAARVREYGLQGMDLIKLWPLPAGADWWKLGEEGRKQRERKELPKGGLIKGNTVVIRMRLAGSKATPGERKQINGLMDQLDALLADEESLAVRVGSLEGHEYHKGECRLFLTCPNADALVKKLRPWLQTLDWPDDFVVLKRYGSHVDETAKEEYSKIRRKPRP